MPKRQRDHRSKPLEDLRDPRSAAYYLKAIIECCDEMYLTAIRNILEAHGYVAPEETPMVVGRNASSTAGNARATRGTAAL